MLADARRAIVFWLHDAVAIYLYQSRTCIFRHCRGICETPMVGKHSLWHYSTRKHLPIRWSKKCNYAKTQAADNHDTTRCVSDDDPMRRFEISPRMSMILPIVAPDSCYSHQVSFPPQTLHMSAISNIYVLTKLLSAKSQLSVTQISHPK